MKHVALSLFAAVCGTLAASALDASRVEAWLSKSDTTDIKVSAIGSGIPSKDFASAKTYVRNWQYVSIPLHVEGAAAKGDHRKVHFIPELTLRISLAMAADTEPGKDGSGKGPEAVLLTQEVTYVDIPLGEKSGKKYEGEVNVGLFIPPSSAFNIEWKEGKLDKKLLAVAVEAKFQGSNCNRIKEAGKEGEVMLIIDSAGFKGHKLNENGWWKAKAGSDSIRVVSIAETPFARDYASMGFAATKPMFGTGGGAAAPAPAAAPAATPSVGGPVGGPVGVSTAPVGSPYSSPADTAADADDSTSSAEEEEDTKASKRSKRDKEKGKKRRSRN